MLEIIVVIFILLSLILYALLGGADFGGGMWDLVATGPRATAQRKAIAAAIGPIWEANHVWLILVIVLLFTAFPRGFSAMMTALNIPLTAMLIGIVLRGAAFTFRKYGSQTDLVQWRWSTVFGAASFFTPLCQGMTLGALATGRIRVENGQVTSGFLAGWLTPFALACGIFALSLFAFLAATYLTVETKGGPICRTIFSPPRDLVGTGTEPNRFGRFPDFQEGRAGNVCRTYELVGAVVAGLDVCLRCCGACHTMAAPFFAGAICRHRPGHNYPVGLESGAISESRDTRCHGRQRRRAGIHASLAGAGPWCGSDRATAVAGVPLPHFQRRKRRG